MSDLRRGEIVLNVEGQAYTLVLDINAQCVLEERFDRPFYELINDLLGKKKTVGIRTIVWAALQTKHPDMTEEDAGRLIQACGGIVGFAKTLQRIVAEIHPDVRDVQELGGGAVTARPRKAQADTGGTGERSTSTHAH